MASFGQIQGTVNRRIRARAPNIPSGFFSNRSRRLRESLGADFETDLEAIRNDFAGKSKDLDVNFQTQLANIKSLREGLGTTSSAVAPESVIPSGREVRRKLGESDINVGDEAGGPTTGPDTGGTVATPAQAGKALGKIGTGFVSGGPFGAAKGLASSIPGLAINSNFVDPTFSNVFSIGKDAVVGGRSFQDQLAIAEQPGIEKAFTPNPNEVPDPETFDFGEPDPGAEIGLGLAGEPDVGAEGAVGSASASGDFGTIGTIGGGPTDAPGAGEEGGGGGGK